METSLAVQWLRLHTSNAGARVQSLVGELGLHAAQPKKKKIKRFQVLYAISYLLRKDRPKAHSALQTS